MVKRKQSIDTRVKAYKNKNGQTLYMFQLYCGTDQLTGKKRRTTRRGFKTALQADLELKRLELKLAQGNDFEQKKPEKFKEIYLLWFENYKRKVKESTWNTTQIIFKKHILPNFGDMYIDKINVSICQKIINSWSETSPKKFKTYKGYTSNIFQYALSLEMIEKNPMTLVSSPSGEELNLSEKEIHYFEKEKLLDFLEAAEKENPFAYTFFHLLAFTGLRKGEALALNWNDINYTDKTLTINKTVARGKERKVYISSTKTRSGNRIISLDDQTIRVMKSWRKIQRNQMKVLNFNSLNKEQLIFPNKDNSIYNPATVKRWLNPILEKYNFKHIPVHSFRHTHASLLAEAGADLKEIQARLGHSDIQTTANIYTHVTKSKRDSTAEKLLDFMSR